MQNLNWWVFLCPFELIQKNLKKNKGEFKLLRPFRLGFYNKKSKLT